MLAKRTTMINKIDLSILILCLYVMVFILLTSCISPVVVGQDCVRLGVYKINQIKPNDYVIYREVVGFGISIGIRQFSLGYRSVQWVYADTPNDGYFVETPLVKFATGLHAINFAINGNKLLNIKDMKL